MEIINLDMTPSTVAPNAHAGQYDSARTVRFMLKNGGVPFTLAGTETITAEITRSDNTEVTVNVANTSSNYVDVVFDDTVCTVKGLYACELRLKDSDGFDIGSKNFALLVQRDPYDGAGIRVVTVGPADICTFETTLPEPLQSVLVNVVATGGNGTPDSPIPVNGYTEANITRCGVNLWNEETVKGTIESDGSIAPSASRLVTKNYIPIIGGLTYSMHIPYSLRGRGAFYDVNKNLISYFSDFPQTGTPDVFPNNGSIYSTDDGYYFTFIPPANARYMKYNMVAAYGTTYNNDISINYPSSDTSYHPYTGNTYTIAFGQTVYGGVPDVTRGKLTVTHVIAVFDGTEVYQLYGTTVVCNKYFTAGLGSHIDMKCSHQVNSQIGYANADKTRFEFRNISTSWGCADIDAFKTFIATQYTNGTPVQIWYPLDTPFDIDLTPEVISAVVGTNNVFADCGETTVKYLKVE